MAFRGNDVAKGLWHRIVCQNEAIFDMCVGPGMGSKAPDVDFESDPRAKVFSFSGCQNGFFFVKELHGAHFSIARDLRAVVGYRLRTTYHMPYARVKALD